jgi:hypothetical protein
VRTDTVREQFRTFVIDARGVRTGKCANAAAKGEITVGRRAHDAVVVQQSSAVEQFVVHRVSVDRRERTPE